MSFQDTALQETEPKRSPQNHRATVRYQCAPATSGQVVLVEKQEMQRAWVLNLSVSGAGLLLSRPLAPGLCLVIRLKSMADNRIFDLPAHAVHSTQQASGDWVVGCELVTPLTADELEALLS